MFDFGIDGYAPRWLTDVAALMAAHGDRLHALVGRTLTAVWLVGPVLLDFGDERVEINHQKFAEPESRWRRHPAHCQHQA